VFCYGEQSKTIQEILTQILSEHGFSEGTDFEFKPFSDAKLHPKRGYVVQYEETDYDFLARWLEHEGIYYYFENKDGQEKVVFADSTGGYRPLSGKKTFRYSAPGPESDAKAFGTLDAEEVVQSFRTAVEPLPKRLILNDYNWRTPDTKLSVLEKVGPRDDLAYAGTYSEYNDHYKDVDEGKALARIRAEEFRCREQVFRGVSSGRAFRPGHVFGLDQYFHGDFNREYLLTQVNVSASQTVALDGSGAAGSAGAFRNEFEAIPDDVTFRPEAVTDWPTIHGVVHGVIDGELNDHPYSQVDADGLYRLRLPFDNQIADDDLETPADGKCSRPTRMAQPFADASDGAGFHFPLHKGTEVVVYHMDGDPDRPVIAGAVPNALNQTPVGDGMSGGQQWNRMTSTSGNTTVFDDSTDSPGVLTFNSTGSSVSDNRDHTTGGGGGPTGFQIFTGKAGMGASGGGGGGAVGRGGDARRAQPGPGLGMGDAELESTRADGSAQDHDGDAKAGEHVLSDYEKNPDGSYKLGADGKPIPIANTSVTGGGSKEEQWEGWIDDLVAKRNAADGKLGQSIAAISGSDVCGYVFSGDKADALRIWDRSTFTILEGTAACTFNNISNSISMDTGGYSYSKSDGDELSYSYKTGDVESHSDVDGDVESHSKVKGNTKSYSTFDGHQDSQSSTFGKNNSASLTLGNMATASCKLSAEADASFTLSGKASASISIGGEVSFALEVAAKAAMNITVAANFALNISAAGEYNINIPRKSDVELSTDEIILNYTGVFLNHTSTAINRTTNTLNYVDNIASYTYNELNKNETVLNELYVTLSKKEAALKEDGNKLSQLDNYLSKSANSLSSNKATLSDSTKAAIIQLG
jgi:type VI secretion system VgrG family protein